MSTPKQIGRYSLDFQIGEGALATVYRARDTKLDRPVALKLLNADGANADIRSRFALEARATANLDHANIVRTYDYSDEDAERLFLVMEFVPGRTLAQWLHLRGPMSEISALCVAHRLVLAIEHAHGMGVIHRDIKPSNVMLHEGRVVLVDFGGVKIFDTLGALGSGSDDKTIALGTPGFMAPEQFEGRKVTQSTDIFAIGALLYNLTTAQLPYHAEDDHGAYDEARRGRFRDPRDHRPLLTPAFCALLSECLAVRPADRVPNAKTLRSEIERLLTAHGQVLDDIETDLLGYEQQHDATERAQSERSVDSAVRDLKLALHRVLEAHDGDKEAMRATKILRQLHGVGLIESELASNLTPKPEAEYLHTSRRTQIVWPLGIGLLAGWLLAAGTLWFGGWLGSDDTARGSVDASAALVQPEPAAGFEEPALKPLPTELVSPPKGGPSEEVDSEPESDPAG